MNAASVPPVLSAASAWAVLHTVPDPEVPALSVVDLGLVRSVHERADAQGGGLEIVLTPTYSGCPATEQIGVAVQEALEAAGLGPVALRWQRAPAWTTDWISPEGRDKLRRYGIAPPPQRSEADERPEGAGSALQPSPSIRPIHLVRHDIACPRCDSRHTERLSAFGSTACKSLHRCLTCREPFEHFKAL